MTAEDIMIDTAEVSRIYIHTDYSLLDLHICKYLQSFTYVHKHCSEPRTYLHTHMDTFRVQGIGCTRIRNGGIVPVILIRHIASMDGTLWLTLFLGNEFKLEWNTVTVSVA